MLSLCCRALVPGHLFYHKLTDSAKQPRRQRSLHPFVPDAKQFLRTIKEQNIDMARWVDHAWSEKWRNGASRLHSVISDAEPRPSGSALPRAA